MRFFVSSQRMTSLTRQSLVGAAMMVSLSGVALADNDCTLKTLRGSYVFAANGYNLVSGVAQPKTIVEVIDFNGDGTLSVPAATRSVNGVIARTPPGGTGSYTVDVGCKGTIAFTGGPSFDIFISPKGETLWMIQTIQTQCFRGRQQGYRSLLVYLGRRTDAARFLGMTCPVASQLKSIRIAAS